MKFGVVISATEDVPPPSELGVSEDPTLTRFAQAIVDQDQARAKKLLAGAPQIAQARVARDSAEECFVEGIRHMVYAGDTALHLAAACYDADIARALVDAGADVAAANRRGAQPLHYAVDGSPGDARWNPVAQREAVMCLLELGADPNAADKNGTSPLHRAVRNRCATAVKALIDRAQIRWPRTDAGRRPRSSRA